MMQAASIARYSLLCIEGRRRSHNRCLVCNKSVVEITCVLTVRRCRAGRHASGCASLRNDSRHAARAQWLCVRARAGQRRAAGPRGGAQGLARPAVNAARPCSSYRSASMVCMPLAKLCSPCPTSFCVPCQSGEPWPGAAALCLLPDGGRRGSVQHVSESWRACVVTVG